LRCTSGEHCHEGDKFPSSASHGVLYGSAKFPEGLILSCSIDCLTFLQNDEQNSFSIPKNCCDFLGWLLSSEFFLLKENGYGATLIVICSLRYGGKPKFYLLSLQKRESLTFSLTMFSRDSDSVDFVFFFSKHLRYPRTQLICINLQYSSRSLTISRTKFVQVINDRTAIRKKMLFNFLHQLIKHHGRPSTSLFIVNFCPFKIEISYPFCHVLSWHNLSHKLKRFRDESRQRSCPLHSCSILQRALRTCWETK